MSFTLTSCSRAGNIDYLKVGDSVDAMYENWGEPKFIEKISLKDNDLSFYSISGGTQVIYYYKFGFDRYKIVCVNNVVYRRFHSNELGSGPFIELDRDNTNLPSSFYFNDDNGIKKKQSLSHEGIGLNLNDYKYDIKRE
jgi:hypothetical protein